MAGKKKPPASPFTPGRAQQIAANAMGAENRLAGTGVNRNNSDFEFLKAVINGDDPNNRTQAQRFNQYQMPSRIDDLVKIYNPSDKALKLANTGGLDNLSDSAIQSLLVSGDMSKPKKVKSTGIPAWDAAYAAMDNLSKAEKAVKYSKAHNEWESFDVKYQRLALTRAQEELGDTSIVWSSAMSQNPEVALAAASAFNNGTLKKQQLKVLNHAMEILQTLNNLSMASSDESRQKMFTKLSGPQQLAVIEVSNALMADLAEQQEKKDAQEKAYQEELKQNEGTVPERLGAGVEAVENLVGGKVSRIWDGLMWLSDNAQHYYRANWQRLESGDLNPFSIGKYWEDTETGAMRKEDYNKLTDKYGKETVDVVRDAVQAMGKEDGWVDLLDKYRNNQAALDIIDEIILEDSRGAKITELLNEVNTLTRDDLGNMIANKLLPETWRTGENEIGHQVWNLLDATTNGAALWFGDPTLIAGKVTRSYKIFKYGLIKNIGPGSLEKIMVRKPVQRLFNNMLEDLRQYDSIVDTTERAFFYTDVIRTKYGKYVTRDFMDDIIAYDKAYGNVYRDNITLVTGYLREVEGLDKLLLGKAVRDGNVLMPRMTAARSILMDRYISTKKFINFDGSEKDFIRSLAPTEIAPLEKHLTPEEFPAYVSGLRADELMDSMIDPVVRNKVANHYGVDVESIILKGNVPKGGKYAEGIVKWGGKTKRLPIGINASRRAWYLRTDRWLRNFENMPRANRVNIATAEDTDIIYAWARTTFSKRFADHIAENWRVMPEGQRRIFLGGMFKTIAEARGLYGLTPEIDAIVDKAITSSLKAGEQYAVTMARPLAMLQDIDILSESSARALRDVLPSLDVAAQQKISALGFRMKQVIEQRKALAQEVKALAFDAGASAKRTKKETSVLEDLAELRRVNSRNASKLKAEFEETEKQLRKILRKLDEEIESTSGVAKLANRETSRQVRESLKSVDRKIRGLEARLGKAAETDTVALQQQINTLKAAREKLAKASSSAYFENRRYKAIRDYLKAEGADFAYYNPAEINGRQHALHADQLSNVISLPNYEVLQSFSVKVGILNKILGWSHQGWVGKGTDYWSSLNLVGPRYIQRAATEDILGYAMAGGRARDAVSGKRIQKTVRRIRGKSEGLISDKLRSNGWLVKEQLTKEEILQAEELAKLGDFSGVQALAIRGLGRMKLKMVLGRELAELEEKALLSWVAQDNGYQLLDEIAEVPDDFLKGNTGGQVYRPDIAETKKVQFGDWTNIEATDSNFHLLWYRKIHSILHRDGRIGQIVFNKLRTSDTIAQAKEKALPEIIEAIRNGAIDRYRYSIFNEPNMTINEFASRYFDDSAWYFSSAAGEAVNKKLIELVSRRNPETGAYFGGLYIKDDVGEIIDRVYIENLRTGFTVADRPRYVLGRKEVTKGMDQYQTPSTLERTWTWMADSLAQVSREPIYFARYIDSYRTLQPLKQAYIARGIEEQAAEALITKLATRRAEEVAIAYMDNPAVRSIAAANVRNLARYYRATEDFYRRMFRLAKYHPEGFQKLNLLYNSFDHSGFVHTDENGNQYFVYPGTGVLNDTVARVVNILSGGNVQIGNPFAFGGLTTMLTPSADPESWKPTFASPFASVPLKIITSFGPFQELEQYLLGTRGTKPSSDLFSTTREIVESTFPSHFARFINALAPDERNSQYASAVRSAIQILAYNGDLDDDKLATVEAQAEAMTKLKNVSAGVLVTRFFLGFMLPASPQILEKDNLTVDARKLGLKALRPAFTQLISKYNGDLDKANAVWYKLNPNLMPFTVAGTQGTLQAYPSLTDKAASWIKEHKDFAKRHPEAAVFLMPRGGEFSFNAHAYAVASKMIEGKNDKEMFLQVITAKDYYVFMQNKEDYQAKYDSTASPFQRAKYEQMWNSYRDEMYANNPYLKQRVGSFLNKSNDGLKDRVLEDLRSSLDEIYSPESAVPTSKSTDKIKSMLATFDDGMTEINRFAGRSDFFATAERKRLKNRLRVILQEIAGKDQNALTLYRTILDGKIN